jgi:hypothetical protein
LPNSAQVIRQQRAASRVSAGLQPEIPVNATISILRSSQEIQRIISALIVNQSSKSSTFFFRYSKTIHSRGGIFKAELLKIVAELLSLNIVTNFCLIIRNGILQSPAHCAFADFYIMSAILSADDLNDFISPGVACIKPVETLPAAKKPSADNVCVYLSLSASNSNNALGT